MDKKKLIRISFLLFFLSFLAGSWFFSIGGWNQVSRYDAIFSFVEAPVKERPNPDYLSFRIDHFITHEKGGVNTGDFSKYQGHFYSNKAPGQILAGCLVYFPLYYFDRLCNGFTDDLWHDVKNCYIINLFTGVIPTCLAVVFLFLSLMILGVPPPASACWSLIYGLATPAFAYSTMVWGHPLAAAFFVFAFYCYLKKGGRNTVLCGLWCGLAALTDYLSAFVPLLFGILFLVDSLREKRSGKEIFFTFFRLFAGGLIPLILFAVYHGVCFGSPFTPATVYNNPIFLEKEKVGGTFGVPSLLIFLKLFFSSHRGIFFLSPVLLAAFPGFFVFRKKAPLVAWGLLIAFLLLAAANASFNGWHGGSTLSPRYLIVLLPVLPILCAFAPLEKFYQKLFWGILGCGSFLVMAISSYSQALVNEGMNNPFFEYILPKFLHSPKGVPASINTIRAYEMIPELKQEALEGSSFSLGEFFGLSGHGSFLLLFLLLALLGGLLWKEFRHFRETTSPLPQEILPSPEKEKSSGNLLLFLLPIAGIGMLFLFPGDEVWINVEPLLILGAFQGNEKNIFAPWGLQGTFQVIYGPLAVWFYQFLLFLTLSPVVLVTLKTLFSVVCTGFALRKIAVSFQLDYRFLLPFLLSSPFMWHFTRKLWDNVFLLPLGFLLAAFLLEYFRTGRKLSLAAGAFTGSLMIFLHPLAIPVVLALPFSLLFRKETKWKKLRDILISTGVISAIPLYHYLPQILKKTAFFSEKLRGGVVGKSSAEIPELFTGVARTFSGTGFRKGFLPEYMGLLPEGWEKFLNILEILLPIFLAAGALWGVFVLWKKLWKEKAFSPEVLLGVWAFSALVFKFLFDCILHLPPYFHYFTVGVPPFAILLFLGMAAWKEKYKHLFLQIFTALFLLLTGSSFFLIHTWEGTKSFVYGPTIRNQCKAVEVLVREMKADKVASLENFIGNYRGFPHSLQVLILLANHRYEYILKDPRREKRKYILHYVSEKSPSGRLTISRIENGMIRDLLADEK